MKHKLLFILVLLFIILSAATVFAHPGRTDSSGGHTDSSTGEYHWHHGYSAHDHLDLDGDGIKEYCPYNHDDATDHTNVRGTVTKSSTGSKKPFSPAPSIGSEDPKQPPSSITTTASTDGPIVEAEDEAFHLQPLSIAALLLVVFSFFVPALFKDFTIEDCFGTLFLTIYCVFLVIIIPIGIALAFLIKLQLSPTAIYSISVILVVIICVILLRIFDINPRYTSDSIFFITYCEALSLLGSTVITQNIPSPSGAETFFITLLALCILIWIYYRFRPKKVTPKPSSEIPPSQPKEVERVFYMEAANGMTVRVPESKLDSWMEAQERIKNGEKSPELTEQEKKFKEAIIERIYGSKSDGE